MSDMSQFIECHECANIFPPTISVTSGMYHCTRCGLKFSSTAITLREPPEEPQFQVKDTQFRIAKARSVKKAYSKLDVSTINDSIAEAVNSFIHNMERATGTIELLYYLVGRSIFFERSVSYSMSSPKSPAEASAEYVKKYDQLRQMEWLAYSTIDEITAKQSKGMAVPLEAMLSSQIIMAWTAFESLSEDLWVQCLNASPMLGLVAIGAKPDSTDDSETAERKLNEKFTIPVWMANEPGFVVGERMGDILRQMRKWNFDNRNSACEAYCKVFGKQCHATIKGIFKNDGMQWLAAIRNNLVHSAGIADGEFCAAMKRHPELCNVVKGTRIQLTGDLVAGFTNEADEQGLALILFVNSWLNSSA